MNTEQLGQERRTVRNDLNIRYGRQMDEAYSWLGKDSADRADNLRAAISVCRNLRCRGDNPHKPYVICLTVNEKPHYLIVHDSDTYKTDSTVSLITGDQSLFGRQQNVHELQGQGEINVWDEIIGQSYVGNPEGFITNDFETILRFLGGEVDSASTTIDHINLENGKRTELGPVKPPAAEIIARRLGRSSVLV
jgi:hypothetical protein